MPSKLIRAGEPSRQRFDSMKRLGFRLIELQFDEFSGAAETWLEAVEVHRLVIHTCVHMMNIPID